MANPYHDGTGKFCSKDNMKAAVDKLAAEGKLDAYFTLRKEYEDIENGTLTVSKEVVQAVPSHSPAFSKITNPSEIRNVYEAIKEVQDSHSGNIKDILTNPHTPEDIKAQINATISDTTRLELVKKFAHDNDPATAADVKALATNTQDPTVLAYIVSSNKVSFEDRYAIAKTYEEGLNALALGSPKAFFAEPELLKEFQQKTESLADAKEPLSNEYLKTLAAHATDEKSHQMILEKASKNAQYDSPYYKLSQNPSISLDTGYKLIENTQEYDLMSYRDIYSNATRKIVPRSYPLVPPETYKGEAPADLEKNLAEWKKNKDIPERAFNSVQAIADSYTANNNRLHKAMKFLRKHPTETYEGMTPDEVSGRLHRSERLREASWLTNQLKQRLYG